MKARYIENQSGKWIIALLFVVSITTVIVALFMDQDTSGISESGILVVALMVVVAGLFIRLRTEVFEDRIRVSFGAGLIRKNIPLYSIQEVRVVRNKWYYGWGIRYYGKGWLWNIWGLDAIEVDYKDKNSLFRIGSQNPKRLKEEIEKLLQS